ncbi:MAG: methyltransferase [bacterium]|nr:MAG: methyltransferase [bacterium]
MDILDAYYKKTIDFTFQDKKLKFKVSQALFSSHIIDSGTQRLLRTFMNSNGFFNKILDLGCGYGPIGITLKTLYPNSEIHMVDRDALALEYAQINAGLNKTNNYKIYASLGYDSVDTKDFDLIISNIPAKVGKNVLSHMLIDSKYFLSNDGFVAIVVVDAILEDVKDILSNPEIEIVLQKSWPGHTVFHYKFNSPHTSKVNTVVNSFDSGLYDRDENTLKIGGKEAVLKSSFNLPEFDEMSYETQMLLNNVTDIKNQNISNCLVFNVNQGHIPVAITLLTKVDKMIVVDRNLQSLKVTERNLINNGFLKENIIVKHQVGISINLSKIDCVVGILNKKDERSVNDLTIDQIVSQLTDKGVAYIVSSSNIITQIERKIKKVKELQTIKRIRYKGDSFISFKFKSKK